MHILNPGCFSLFTKSACKDTNNFSYTQHLTQFFVFFYDFCFEQIQVLLSLIRRFLLSPSRNFIWVSSLSPSVFSLVSAHTWRIENAAFPSHPTRYPDLPSRLRLPASFILPDKYPASMSVSRHVMPPVRPLKSDSIRYFLQKNPHLFAYVNYLLYLCTENLRWRDMSLRIGWIFRHNKRRLLTLFATP